MTGLNLANDAWIPCVLPDGTIGERSLRDCLREAPELVGLAVGSPIASFALHRLLLAVVHGALRGPASLSEAVEFLKAGRFDARVDEYLDRWQGRFELFDAERPFMQPATDSSAQPRTVAVLVHEWASGNNTTLADHHIDADPPGLSAAQAARALATTQAFAVGGGISKPLNFVAAPVTPRVACLLTGSRLFDTLVANLVR